MSPSQKPKSIDTLTREIINVITKGKKSHAILDDNRVIETLSDKYPLQRGNKVILGVEGNNIYLSEIYDTSGKLLYSKP